MDIKNITSRFIILIFAVSYHVLASADCIDTIDIALIKSPVSSILIDTRATQLFNQFKLPGSINVTANTIALKTVWRKKALYLIGHGYDDSRMLELCRQLYSTGFENVSVIKNGVLASNDADIVNKSAAYQIEVQDLVNILNLQQAVLLDTSKARETAGLGINGVYYVSGEGIDAFIKSAGKSRTISHLPIIIIDSDISAYRALYALNSTGDEPVYFVNGNIGDLKKYLAYIDNVKRKTKFELQDVKKCGS